MEKKTNVYSQNEEMLLAWSPDNEIELRDVKDRNIKYLWKCQEGHVSYRTCNSVWLSFRKGKGTCTVCHNYLNKSMAKLRPELLKEWDYNKNDIDPHYIGIGSDKRIWWNCSKGHSYQIQMKEKVQGRQCYFCVYSKTVHEGNNLSITHPEIASEWDKDKNELTPQDVSYGSDKKIWWICQEGHSYEASVKRRTVNENKCPICAGRTIIPELNSLSATHPEIASEWDKDKNKLSAGQVSYGSTSNAYWKCKNGHSYQCVVKYRTIRNSGCPECYSTTKVSIAEKELQEWIKEIYPQKVITSDRATIFPRELDIYIPDKNIAIEFNGLYWHSEAKSDNSQRHREKFLMCQKEGISLITIWEDDWNEKPHIIKEYIKSRLFDNDDKKEFSSEIISSEECRKFFSSHCINQFKQGSFYIGVMDSQDNLVDCSIWNKEDDGSQIMIDYAIHGMDRRACLLSMLDKAQSFIKNSQVYVISHNDFSDNKLFSEVNGFKKIGSEEVNYMLKFKSCRVPKEYFTEDRFINDEDLRYNSGMSLEELMELNNIYKVWDSGKTVYSYSIVR